MGFKPTSLDVANWPRHDIITVQMKENVPVRMLKHLKADLQYKAYNCVVAPRITIQMIVDSLEKI